MIVLLIGGLIVVNGFYFEVYNIENIIKVLIIIIIGWVIYICIF